MKKVICAHCDLLLTAVAVTKGQRAICPRCGQMLYTDKNSLHVSTAIIITALIIYIPAVCMPFLSIETSGQQNTVSLITSITAIASGKMIVLAILVSLTVLLLPFIKLCGLLAITIQIHRKNTSITTRMFTRHLLHFTQWNMLDVYLIGVLITLVKLSSYASIQFLGGFYVFLLLMILNTIVSIRLSKQRLWQHMHALDHE